MKISEEHEKSLDEWFSRPVAKRRFYQLIQFTPNPYVDWRFPVGFVLVDTGVPKFVQVTETLPAKFKATAHILLGHVLEGLLKVDSKASLLKAFQGMGPHFVIGPAVEIPELIPDAEKWTLDLFRGSV